MNVHQIIYMPAILLTKCALLLQLIEFFVPRKAHNQRWWILNSLIAANVVFFTISFFIELFECWPRKKIWKPKVPGRCIPIERIYISTASINVVDDFAIVILPLTWIWKLQMRWNRKIGVSIVFATALL